jgi:hypothetical protein
VKTAEIRELELSSRSDMELELEELCNEFELLDNLNPTVNSDPKLTLPGQKRESSRRAVVIPADIELEKDSVSVDDHSVNVLNSLPSKLLDQERVSFDLYTSGDFSVGFVDSPEHIDPDVVDPLFLPPEQPLLDDDLEIPTYLVKQLKSEPEPEPNLLRSESEPVAQIEVQFQALDDVLEEEQCLNVELPKKEPPVFDEPSRLSASIDASILWEHEKLRQQEREQEATRIAQEQEERAAASRKIREAERKRQEAEWAARELALTKQLEEDRKRLEMLANNSLLFAQFNEAKQNERAPQPEPEPEPPVPEPPLESKQESSTSQYFDEETDPGFEEFEPISDSDSEE